MWSLCFVSCVAAAVTFARAGLQSEWNSVTSRVERERPEWERSIREAVRDDFLERLGEESPWRLELANDEDRLLAELLDVHVSSPFEIGDVERDGGVWRSSIEQRIDCRVDFFSESIDAPERLASASPGVRVLDLTLRLRAERRGLGASRRIEICRAGAWLDEAVAERIAASFDARDVVVTEE